jgi:hypothetical protein
MIIQTFYAGLIFSSRNLLDSAAGGTFMSITLGEATKFLDNMMINYSEWHTKRAPQGKSSIILLKQQPTNGGDLSPLTTNKTTTQIYTQRLTRTHRSMNESP